MKKTVLEFFAGIGLMRMGLERAGWEVVYANDIDPGKQRMYLGQYRDAADHFDLGDIHKLAPEKLPTASLATASFPCNDLSLAGARAGLKGSQSSAYWGFTKLLEALGDRKPKLVLLENVPGFLTSNGGKDFHAALKELNRLGYWVDTFVLDAAWFVPQSRQRLFVVGTRIESKSGFVLEEPADSYGSDLRPPALSRFIFSHPDINWLLRPLPVVRRRASTLDDIVEQVPPGSPEWWSQERVDYLLNQMSPRHRKIADEMIAGTRYSHGTVFRRVRNHQSMAELRTDGIAGCLRTPRGGSGRQILFKGGRGKAAVRLLNGRECARLMGADNFKLDVPLNQALFGFGDAVCVPAIEWIAKNYFETVIAEMKSEKRLVRTSA